MLKGKIMIYLLSDLNSDDIIEISDWEVVRQRENFHENVDLKDKKLFKIIGSYELQDKRTCGITSCHKAHNRGYIVATEDGIETNIGNDCGFKYFNVAFNDLTNLFLRNLKNEQRKLSLFKAIAKISEWRKKADLLKEGEFNIDWAIKNIELIKNPSVIGRYASTELKRMASTSTTKVTISRVASKKEADIQEVFDRKYAESEEQTVEVAIGSVEHVDCLLEQNDLRQAFYMSVTKVMKELMFCNPSTMSSPAMAKLVLKVNNIEFNLNFSSERLEAARRFLKKENLQPIYDKMYQMDIVSRSDLQRYSNFINCLPAK
ncbi:hypothetical protein AF22_02538 [Klebsiella pneumoniae CHS 66]|nr:hypothetical protein AF22_02538 [Klebsiella pneumoniae CHS 66]SSJ20697.1 Uncharacterised protein [Klebsiella pneumoniae]SWG50849.1 Uncharacterised protein [Klebsiella pneumoniae]SWL17062.1 Uncharacterised protein [Klebsiella pneumoniae]SXH27480.1 Uncharacterised protein [Klebsiella pneumoniae]